MGCEAVPMPHLRDTVSHNPMHNCIEVDPTELSENLLAYIHAQYQDYKVTKLTHVPFVERLRHHKIAACFKVDSFTPVSASAKVYSVSQAPFQMEQTKTFYSGASVTCGGS